MEGKSFFVGETKKFKIFFHLSNIEVQTLHDLYSVRPSATKESDHLITSIAFPLEDRKCPVFHSVFDSEAKRFLLQRNFFNFSEGFVHARNYLQDHFISEKNLDLIVFDHGYDLPPFPGGKAYFFRSDGESFSEDSGFIHYPKGYVFSGCSGDWDQDGLAELIVFDLQSKAAIGLKNTDHALNIIPGKMPDLMGMMNFCPLSGTKFKGLDGELHVAIGSCGDHWPSASDLFIKNDGTGNFSGHNVKQLPTRRCGVDWACIEMRNVRFIGDTEDLIIANYHNARVQHGNIDLYKQVGEDQFEYAYSNDSLMDEKDSWFYRFELFNLYQSKNLPDSILALKSRGLENFKRKEFNFAIKTKINGEFVDVTEELAPLRDKEFMGIATRLNSQTGLHDLIFFDNHGNHFYCQTKA